MGSKSELKNIESIVGGVLLRKLRKSKYCFSTNDQYFDGSRKEEGKTHYTKST
jgi:hypothetical protein